MLDGLLGRNGFTTKCKSLIKPTRTRIAVLKRREEAKQRFLKEDLAKLLANGLDVNAYGRTEEFIAGLNLLACYTFLDQSCEYIYKQLSVMQKLGQCPEECRETVSSLMFAAARFSDLPELRDLRDAFQERYGNGLECYVNQVFVEKLASKPPSVEKRIKLLQDIAAELSIQWDSKGFKQRMDKPSTLAQALGSLSGTDDEQKPPNGNNMLRKNDQRSKERVEHAQQGPTLHGDENVNIRRKDVLDGPVLRREEKHHKERREHHDDRNVYSRRKEVSDISNVETNKTNGYKCEDVLHGDEVVDTRRKDVLDGSALRREEKYHKERREYHDDGNVYGRRKEASDISHVEPNKKHGYKHESLTNKTENGDGFLKGNSEFNHEKNIFGKNDRIPKVLDDRVMRERKGHAYKHELEAIEARDNNMLDGSVLRREEKHHKERTHYKERTHHHDELRREEKHHKERIYHHDELRRKEKHHNERIYYHDDGNYVHDRRKEVLDTPYVETNYKHGYKHELETNEKYIFGNSDRGRKERNGYKHEPETMETRDSDDHRVFNGRHKTRSPTRNKEDGENSTGKVKEEDKVNSKLTYNSSLPPPYVKLNIPPPYSKPHNASNSEKMKEEADHDIIQLPKPKSVRRKHRHKHSKSSSSHDDNGGSEDGRIVKRISSSRRKDWKGLQILFDDEQYHTHRDDEEKMMDKLLLHYSKKPSSPYDIERLREKKSKSPSTRHNDAEMIVPPTRSISLPHEQSGEVETKKVYARANSFQPDNQAKHVHPKLPDYDDLAARFAALRGG